MSNVSTSQKIIERNSTNKNSSWLTAKLSNRDEFVLSKQEFRDGLALRYNKVSSNLPSSCDGCGEIFDVQNALSCKKGGLISQRHNEVRDIVAELSQIAWKQVHKEPVIRETTTTESGLRADFLIRGVWNPQETASYDIRVTDTDARSYGNRSTAQVLKACESEKKNKHLEACRNRHIIFTPLVASVDGCLGKEFQHFVKRVGEVLAEKWEKPYSVVV